MKTNSSKEILKYKECGKADLHIHSIYSQKCGLNTIAEIMDYVEKMTDLDVIAITDHNEIKGAQEALAMSKRYSFEVIVGEEILTKQGEVIGLFLKEKIPSKMSLLNTIKAIHQQGGIVIIPHPFYFYERPPFPGLKRAVSLRNLNKILKLESPSYKINALEAFNPSWAGFFCRRLVRNFNPEIFNLSLVTGSDAHSLEQIGKSYTLFLGHTAADLKESILNKKTIIQTCPFWTTKDNAVLIQKNIKKRLKKYRHKIKEKIKNNYS